MNKIDYFEELKKLAREKDYKQSVMAGSWEIIVLNPGNFKIRKNDIDVLVVKDYYLVDFEWGFSYREYENYYIYDFEILKFVLEIPGVKVDINEIERLDGFAALGYSNPVHLMSLDENMDLEYELGWYVSKKSKEENKKNYVLFWDKGNGWCSVDKAFESMDEEEFLKESREYLNI